MGAEGAVFEGKTLDDAVRKGLEALGLARAEVSIKVVSEGSGGFLGLGARPYRVLIMPRPGGAFAEPREERGNGGRGRRERGGRGGRDRNERGRGGERRGERAGGERRAAPAEARRGERGVERSAERGGERGGERGRRDDRGRREPRRDERRDDRGRREERGPREAPARAETRPVDEERMPMSATPADAGSGSERGEREDGGRRRRRRGGRGRRGEGRPMSPEREGAMAEAPENEGMNEMHEARTPHHEPDEAHETHETHEVHQAHGANGSGDAHGPVLTPEQLVSESTRITGDLLKAMGFEATVNATADADRVDVTAAVTGDEELLTGPKGEVRQALQHLLNRMLNRGEGSRYHLQLEINEFWKRRETELEGIARDLADEAINNQTEAVTEYLNSQERRIVHMTLKPDARVKTYALGSGLIKRVAVAPADFPEGPQDE